MLSELINYYAANFSYIAEQFSRHFLIAIYGVLFACIVGIPLGFYVSGKEKAETSSSASSTSFKPYRGSPCWPF